MNDSIDSSGSLNNIQQGKFVERPNRFLGRVNLGSKIVETFIPNPGRMYELMIPGKEVYVRQVSSSSRKTQYDLIGVKHNGVLVSIDSYLPNRFMKQLLLDDKLETFAGASSIKSEPRAYEGRFDFFLQYPSGNSVYIEVKSCTLVEDGRAIFPDAPTERGARHVETLAKALDDGLVSRSVVIFVIQRPDAKVFSPNDPTDSKFGNALRRSHDKGVEILALRTEVVNWKLVLRGEIPIDLEFFSNDRA